MEMKDIAGPFSQYEFVTFAELASLLDGARGKDRKRRLDVLRNDYDSRIGGPTNAVNAFKLVSSYLEGFPEPFRRTLWYSVVERLTRMLEDYKEEDPLGDYKDLEQRVNAMRAFIEECHVIDGATDESIACIRKAFDDDSLGLLDEDDRYWDVIRGLVEKYTYARNARINLWKIAQRAGMKVELIDLFEFCDPIKSESTVTITREGFVRVRADAFGFAVDGIDATRIRQCEICDLLFWAGRKDSWCCSSSCADKRRKRTHRAKLKSQPV